MPGRSTRIIFRFLIPNLHTCMKGFYWKALLVSNQLNFKNKKNAEWPFKKGFRLRVLLLIQVRMSDNNLKLTLSGLEPKLQALKCKAQTLRLRLKGFQLKFAWFKESEFKRKLVGINFWNSFLSKNSSSKALRLSGSGFASNV